MEYVVWTVITIFAVAIAAKCLKELAYDGTVHYGDERDWL